MAHGLAHMKTSGDLVFFSFGTGKDVTGFGGGAVCVHDKYIDILTVLKEKSSVYKDDDLKKSLITVLPEVIFSTTPVYEFFIFPYLYLVSLLKRSVVDDILTGRDEYISRDLKTMHPFQAYMILNQLKGFEKRMKRRKRIGRYISRHLPLLPNSTYLCAACRTDRKQTEKILESLMKNGIDCRRDYMDFLQEHPLKDCLIYIPTHHQMNIRHIRRIIRLLKRGEKPKI
jgi:dTDP-4-amino-4,6-dideoxygalactose transaminase